MQFSHTEGHLRQSTVKKKKKSIFNEINELKQFKLDLNRFGLILASHNLFLFSIFIYLL